MGGDGERSIPRCHSIFPDSSNMTMSRVHLSSVKVALEIRDSSNPGSILFKTGRKT